MNSIALAFMLCMGALTLMLPKRFALVPILMVTCYMTLGQRLIFMGLDFTIFRILILFGWLRLIVHKEYSVLTFNNIDKALLWWGVIALVAGTLLDSTLGNLVHRSGQVYNSLGTYFFFRFYIENFDDIKRILQTLAIIILPLAIAILIEKSTGRNFFSIFGGVPEITMVRYGRLRCQGPFAHPILAGTLGATLIPFFIALWFDKTVSKTKSMIGMVSSTIIVFASASSGPALSYIAALGALCVWPFRNNMRAIRWFIVISIVIIDFFMKAPIWFLIGKVGFITGGTGWHRSEVIDTTIKHFNEWWLMGTTYTAHWMEDAVLPNLYMIDITNQYILEGVYGGLGRMILFIAVIVFSFQQVGRALQKANGHSLSTQFTIWALGASLFSHVVSFISVAYFDQLVIIWCLLLAMISADFVRSDNAEPHHT